MKHFRSEKEKYAEQPNRVGDLAAASPVEALSSIEKFSVFMRILALLLGLGQRMYFLHDRRSAELRQTLLAHQSEGSEANAVVTRFTRLPEREQQDLLNFLRSL